MTPIHFYISESHLPHPEAEAEWKSGGIVRLHESGKIAAAQCWIYQTHLLLANAGLPVALTTRMPDHGIVIALSGSFNDKFVPPEDLFFVGISADYHPHPNAHWHIVQNGRQAGYVPRSTYIPLWPHPNLVGRNATRGKRFESAAFFGDPLNLAPELRSPSWAESLKRDCGVEFQVRRADLWHDFNDVDCAVAIRSFDSNPHHHKPPTKLFNAWLAGVPFIAGADSAYRAERVTQWDFLEATSPRALLECIRLLKNDSDLREKVISASRLRAAYCTREAIVDRWRKLVLEILPREAAKWHGLSHAGKTLRRVRQRIVLSLLGRLLPLLP